MLHPRTVFQKLLNMTKTILYFHGFKSSSDSTKAHNLKKFIKHNTKNTLISIPDLSDSFEAAIEEINKLVEACETDIVFMGSSLGGYYATHFSQLLNVKAVLINPAIPPLKGFDIHLGKNENYATGHKFIIEKSDIAFLRSLKVKKLSNPENIMVLVESGDEILPFEKTVTYFNGAHLDITFGGDHSYQSLTNKYIKIKEFLNLS